MVSHVSSAPSRKRSSKVMTVLDYFETGRSTIEKANLLAAIG